MLVGERFVGKTSLILNYFGEPLAEAVMETLEGDAVRPQFVVPSSPGLVADDALSW